jgi:hypothetical protein
MLPQPAPVRAVQPIGFALGTLHKYPEPRKPLFYCEIRPSPKLAPPRGPKALASGGAGT